MLIAAVIIGVTLVPALLLSKRDMRPLVIGGVRAGSGIGAPLARILDRTGEGVGLAIGECTGTVVAPRLVLTAGHCVERIGAHVPRGASGYRVYVGASVRALRVSRGLVAPGYTGLTGPDAGLLVLSRSTAATPEALAPARSPLALSGGQAATLVGWSAHYSERGRGNEPVQADTIVQAAALCEAAQREEGPLEFHRQYEICTLDPPRYGTGICKGESGGPLLLRTATDEPVEVGIAVSGSPTCSTRRPSNFTRASAISTWVQKWIDAIG